MSKENAEVFDLMAAKMAALKRQMIDDLNRQMFRSDGPVRYVPPPTFRERLRRRWQRVRGYFSVLWDALRGRDPYDVEREDW